MPKYTTKDGKLHFSVLYNNGRVKSGTCGNGRTFTNAEIINYNNGHDISREAE